MRRYLPRLTGEEVALRADRSMDEDMAVYAVKRDYGTVELYRLAWLKGYTEAAADVNAAMIEAEKDRRTPK